MRVTISVVTEARIGPKRWTIVEAKKFSLKKKKKKEKYIRVIDEVNVKEK